MSELKRVLRCYHCGAILQDENPEKEGYISKEVLEGLAPKIPYCNSCFKKMEELNSGYINLEVEEDAIKVLKDAVATDACIVWVVDLFSFDGTINPDIAKRVKKLKIIVIGNKRDLFSRTINDETFVRFIRERFAEYGIKPAAIKIFGGEGELDTIGYYETLNKFRRGHDVYMIGSSQSGKTVIINKLLKSYKNKTKWNINSELYPDTELKVLSIPFDNSSFFYEIPGWPQSASVVSKVEKDVLKYIVPRKKFHAQTLSLSEGDSLMVGGLAGYSLLEGKSTQIKFYASEDVEIRKIKTNKFSSTLQENYHKRMVRPVSDRFNSFSDYDVFEYTMDNDGVSHDISIEGLCWISLVARGQKIRVMLPKGVALKEYPSKVR